MERKEKKKLEIHISADSNEKLETMAKRANLPLGMLASILLEAFVDHDGNVFVGEWSEGPGIRLLPDWPRFSSGVVKIKESEIFK
jgi:hypothetical protein